MDKEQTNRVLNNITILRKAYGESYENLARAIGYEDKSGVANWYSRGSVNDAEKLKRVAQHYRIPISTLLDSDLSDFKIPVEQYKDPEKQIFSFFILFPLAFNDNESGDPLFEKAFHLHTEYIRKGFRKNYFDPVMFDEMWTAYERSFEDNATIEAFINMTSLCILTEVGLKNPWMLNLSGTRVGTKDFNEIFLPNYKNDLITSDDETQELERQVVFSLRKIKQQSKYADLADYYMAIRYFWALPDNGLSWADNQMVGNEMISSFAWLGNKYALLFEDEFKKTQ